MIYNDEITQRLNELLYKHPEFKKLADNDATVYAWLKTAMSFENREYIGSAEEMLVGIIVALGRDKQAMFDSQLKHANICMTPKKMKL